MNMIEMIDKLASDLEEKGLIKEAAMLDVISNTLEKEAYVNGGEPASVLYKEKLPNTIELVGDLIAKAKNGQIDPNGFKNTAKNIKVVVDEIIDHFEYFKKTFMAKGSERSLDMGDGRTNPIDVEKAALDVPMEQEKRSLLNEVDAILKIALEIKRALLNPDPSDLMDVSKGLQSITSLWKKASGLIAKRMVNK